ncbi:MAG: carbohydrate ABC transporter permease [Oscillospiraceae bacterium]|nr:carbohydrate ABC transporter permease [Oscillospiraceae bacterium]
MNKIKRSVGDRAFDTFNIILQIAIAIVMIYPMLYVLFASFSDPMAFVAHKGVLWHSIGFTFNSYKAAFENPMLLKGYSNTLFVLVFGVTVNIIMTICGAYFLSRKNVKYQKIISIYIIITMFLNGGMIPFYFVVKSVGLENSLWSLILPTAVNTFNLMILRVAFASVPDSLEESAKLDGANHLTIMLRIVLPVSKASIAVIVLYYAVANWNAWFNAMLFLIDRPKYPLQLVLREILINNDTSSMTGGAEVGELEFVGETIKYAIIIISTLPILCLYPFIQKYFTKGVMIGAVKG